ncbi:MAG: DUF5906 domain-containing protein [archaeon]
MTDLIAVLGTGKGTWAHVSALIRAENWENIHIITNDFGKDKFNNEKNAKLIILDENLSVEEMKEKIAGELKDKLKLDVAINLISGSGKEHMALLSALMSLGVGMRFVIEKDGMKEL